MNTGKNIQTQNLLLIPSSNRRDAPAFLDMLRNDGSFREWCGIGFSERHLSACADYFERVGNDQCLYSIFIRSTKAFIGYVGLHKEDNANYEIEFYISKAYRRKGYCEEACRAIIGMLFAERLSVDGRVLTVEKLYATTLSENTAVINLLLKLGFKRDRPKDGPILVMQGFVDEENDEIFECCISKFVMRKGDC